MSNFFDQFDGTADSKRSGNFFDKFDDSEAEQDGALKRGWNKAAQRIGITKALTLRDNERAAALLAEAAQYERDNPGTPEGAELMAAWRRGDGITGGIAEVAGEFAKDWREAPGVVAGIKATGKNIAAMGAGVVEQTPNMLAPMAGMLAGGAAGAASPVPGGTLGGAWLGASAGNALVEGGGMAQEALAKAGIHPDDTEAVRSYLDQHGDTILQQAGIKGAVIGAVDTATMGIAGKLLMGPAKEAAGRALVDMGVDLADKAAVQEALKSPVLAARVAADPAYRAATSGAAGAARNATAAALEPAGEFAGEYLGQGLATGEYDTKEAFLEAASSIGQSGATFAGQKLYAAAKYPFKANGDAAPHPATDTGAVDAEEVLGMAPPQTEAEKALYTPKSITALDRVAEIDEELQALGDKGGELQGEQVDKAADLQGERARITSSWPAATPGAQVTFSTETGARLDGQYALMEAGDLTTSHDENLRPVATYPAELQPRERERHASELQVQQIVQKLDPARLGESADVATGAPIVGADGLVESGNARTIALMRVYQANGQKADDYRGFIKTNADRFGIDPAAVDAMQRPVLVRVRTTPVNRAEFARQANAATVARMSPSEQARADAAAIDSLEDLNPDEAGDFMSGSSTPFVRRFLAKQPTTEQAALIDASGRLSQAGYSRIRNAVLAKAYGDSPVLLRMVESMDDSTRNVTKALIRVAPQVAKTREAIGEGALHDADMTPDLLAAVEELASLKEKGVTVEQALAQAGMFGDKLTPEARDLLAFLNDNIRSPRRIADFIQRYLETLEAAGNPNQGSLLGDATAPAKGDLLAAAKRGDNGIEEDAGRRQPAEGGGVVEETGGQPADAQGDRGGAGGDEAAGGQGGVDARAAAAQDFQDALADLGAIVRDYANVARVVPEDTPGLMDTMVRLFGAAMRMGYHDAKKAVAYVKEQLRADDRFKSVWNKIQQATYQKAAKQAADDFAQGGLFGATEAEAPADGKATTGENPIPIDTSLTGEAAEIQARFRDWIWNNLDEAIAQYQAANGNVLNTDEARKLSPDYNATPETRSLYSAAVHEPASWLIKEIYRRELDKAAPEGKDDIVLFTAGGTGAGKSSSVKAALSGEAERTQIVFDTNMNGLESSDKKIRQALDAGKRVLIVYVYRDPLDALVKGALTRAMNPESESYGRTVPIGEHIKTHVGSSETIGDLAEAFKDDARVVFVGIDNSLGRGNSRQVALESMPRLSYNGIDLEAYHEAVRQEHQADRISDAVLIGTLGALGRRVQGVGRQGSASDGRRPELADQRPAGQEPAAVDARSEDADAGAENGARSSAGRQSGVDAGNPVTLDSHAALLERVRAGTVMADQFKAAFESAIKSRDAIVAELSAMTKDAIFKRFPGIAYRYKNEKKADVVDVAYRSMLDSFVLADSISWSMGQKYEDVIRGYVEKTTDEALREFAAAVKAAKAEREQRAEDAAVGMENPQTLDDFKRVMSAKAREIGEGATFAQARMAMPPEQRAKFDELAAEKSRGDRSAMEDQRRTTVRAAGQAMEGQVIETKHTKTGEPLFVVKAAERVEREVYNQWNTTAKRLGGWYSSYRGGGAVPGFQFKTRDNAEAFLKYIGGDVQQAAEVVQERRDAFRDDRSQSAVERLNEMAGRLDERADESLGQERKANTERRARMAASAEAAANADKALAGTMRNIARAIENKTAKFLNRVRQKTQVELLQSMVRTAQDAKIRAQYPAYADQEKHKGEAPNGETADYAEFPVYAAYRSDLAGLGRALLETDGTKKLGQQLMKVADDVSAAYLKFAKENLTQVSAFRGRDGSRAAFASKQAAETAIERAGYHGAAIVLPFKRGENLIVLSPSEAIKRGIWEGDNDKRITLSGEFGAEIVEKLGKLNRRGRNGPAVPWQFESAYDKRKKLAAMGIETPAEMRAALREFIGLRQAPKARDRIKELERAMIGRRADGLDFFPTAAATTDELVDTAGIEPGMSTLEPEAGMGHIADRIREAGVEPDVAELSGDRRELLEAKGYNVVGHDFLAMTMADTPDGNGYDRVIMNPPFSDRRDAQHVQHAYSLLKPGGRVVAIMGEGVFFGQDKKAQAFRDWLDGVGGTSEKLPEGSFMDPTLPVNTSVNARMVVIDKPAQEETAGDASPADGARYSSRSGTRGDPLGTAALDDVIDRVVAAAPGQWSRETVVSAPLFADLPAPILAQAKEAGYDEHGQSETGHKLTGVTYEGKVYLVQENISSELEAEETLLHERIHHILQDDSQDPRAVRLRRMLGNLYERMDGLGGIKAQAKRLGIDISGPLADMPKLGKRNQAAFIVEEFLAHAEGARAYEGMPQRWQRIVKEFWGGFRIWLRGSGFVKLADDLGARLADYTAADLAWTLKGIRESTTGSGSKAIRFMTAWHGSPHDHDGFDSSKIGTGEGAQAYGWGHYFAGAREVAEWYRNKLASGYSLRGKKGYEHSTEEINAALKIGRLLAQGSRESMAINLVKAEAKRDVSEAKWLLDEQAQNLGKRVDTGAGWGDLRYQTITQSDVDAAALGYEAAKRRLEVIESIKPGDVAQNKGRLYQVDLKPAEDEYLDWDKPLSGQSAKVKEALENSDASIMRDTAPEWADDGDWRDSTGVRFYSELSRVMGSPEAASRYLHSAGIRGIRYLDGSSRSAGDGNYNYVIFDDADVTISAKLSRMERALFAGRMRVEDVRAVVEGFRKVAKNLPTVHVLQDTKDAPRAVQKWLRENDAMLDAAGLFHDGEIYLFASHLADIAHSQRVFLHEAQHYGLSGIFGTALDEAMLYLYEHNGGLKVKADARQVADRSMSTVRAVEEVLADMAGDAKKLTGWKRLVAAVRDWLRKAGWVGTVTDTDVAYLIHRAELYWQRAQKSGYANVKRGRLMRLADDLAAQEKWLSGEAKARGFASIDELAEKDYPLFENLAALWRQKHPVKEAMLSRAGTATPALSLDQQAEAVIQQKAGTPQPFETTLRAVTQATKLDKLTTAAYSKAAALLDRYTPETIKAGIVSDYGIPEAVLDRRAVTEGRQRKQLRAAGMLLEKLATLTRAESRVAYAWMNNDDPQAAAHFEEQLPPESLATMREVRSLIDKLSQEAVKLGQLDPEAFKRNRFAYLHRSYVKHTAELSQGETKSRARAISILGDQYKGRGMTDAADMARIKNVAPEWWNRKLRTGQADKQLRGEQFIRLERRAPAGEGTEPLPGIDKLAKKSRLLEVAYWPAADPLPTRYATWDQAGTWEVRGTKGAKVVLWRDFTAQERQALGEIDEVRFAIAKTLHAMIHDVETGKYLEWLAQTYAKKEGEEFDGTLVEASERMRDTFKPGEWVKVPDSEIPGTKVKKYGVLAGRYLPGPIWNDVRQMGGHFKPLGEAYSAILRAWKSSKTALSPAVHMNNVMANFVMADWHDVTAGHVAKALRLMLSKDEVAAEVLARYGESGGTIGTWATKELQQEQLKPMLEALEKELGIAGSVTGQVGVMSALQLALRGQFPAAWDAFKPSKTGQVPVKAARAMIALYEAEDQVFRLAAWLKAKEEGATDLVAGKAARKSFLDYSINAPWVQMMRTTAFPFIAFTYRSVPMLLETAAKKPWKLFKLGLVAGAANALGYLFSGGDEDDERKLLPEEKAGRIWGITPKLVRMPWNDANGSPVFLDVRRWVPVGDIFDTGATNAAVPVLPAMMPGGPLALLAEIGLNKTQFTGKAITLETDTPAEKAAKLADHLYKAFAPNIILLPGTYAWTGAVNAGSGKTDSFGREQSLAQAVISSVGIKVGSYPKDVLQLNAQREAQAKMMEIDRNLTGLKREYQRRGITSEELQEKAAVQVAKKRKVMEDLQKRMAGG